MTPRALLISGAGRYADPWHPFARTSAAIAEILTEAGLDVRIAEDVDDALAGLAESAPALLILNIGDPAGPRPGDVTDEVPDTARDERSRSGLLAHLAAGRPLLAFHVSSTSLGYVPEWESVLGGIWVPGTTMHPDQGDAWIEVDTDAHPIVTGVADFEVHDERYSWMRVSPEVSRLAWHEHDGERHPLLWTHEYGSARVVYDALGHDERSYLSAPRRTLVSRSARWLLGGL
ncbi:MAG TPA: ThuA domain-containing protein [Ornithinibacter sp.]|nr:ThuA domain-containing protein [Ornithinibacter sp.]